MSQDNENLRRHERKAEQRKVEFFVDADIINGASVDRSAQGIRMHTDSPIQISMRMYTEDGTPKDYQASLCWAGREEDGSMSYGLEFVDEPDW